MSCSGPFLGLTFPATPGDSPIALEGLPTSSSPVETGVGLLLFEPSCCQEEENTAKPQREQAQRWGGG